MKKAERRRAALRPVDTKIDTPVNINQ